MIEIENEIVVARVIVSVTKDTNKLRRVDVVSNETRAPGTAKDIADFISAWWEEHEGNREQDSSRWNG